MKKWALVVLVVLVSVGVFLAVRGSIAESKVEDYETLRCVMEDEDGIGKMEMYFDFNQKKVYRYSIISTNALNDRINI